MFGSLYDDDYDDGVVEGDLPFATATRSYRYRPDNCASLLEMPDKQRDPREFAGLKNQGATCYMNSFIQTLYMIQEFRNAILKMPLCKDNPETPSGYLEGQKYQILYCLQKLFVQLKAGVNVAASTIELTDAFGWKENQQMVQHDVQEASKELLGVLERALKGTDNESLIQDIFGGIKSNIIQVPEHSIMRSRDEGFFDLMVQVKGLENLEASLSEFFNFEFLQGDNQYYLEEIDQKVDALKGVQIKKFPKILTVSLMRFDLDYTTFQYKKLNECFKFPLELSMNQYLTEDSDQKGEEIEYELLSCIIHIGGVGGGHYKAYIRDYGHEGTWDFDLYNEEDRKEVKPFDPNNPQPEEEKKETKPDEKHDQEPQYDGDFPLPYKNKELGKDWYEFNDSFVRPIVAGRLESQFGNGSSNQNAYILMYRRKNEKEQISLEDIPEYWRAEIERQNEASMKERDAYETEQNHLEIYLQPEIIFQIEFGAQIRYIDLKDTEEQGEKIKFRFDITVADLKTRIRETLNIPADSDFDAFETCKLSNDLNQVFRALSDYKDTDTIKQTDVSHLSTWLVSTNEATIEYMRSIKGMDKEPIYINYRFHDEETRKIMYRNMFCSDFIMRTAEIFGFDDWKLIKLTYFTDGLMRRLDRLKYNVEKECEHTLKSLSVGDNSQIVVEAKTPEEIKLEEENQNLKADFLDPNSTTKVSTTETFIDVDETENIRSVLMHKEEDPEFLERFNIDINWTIQELHEKLMQYMGIDPKQERRLRREYDNSLIVKEELGVQLKDYPEFQEGGVRLKMEFGRFPSIEELALTVAVYGNLDFTMRFYFKKDSTIAEGKEKICEDFGLDPKQYRLWRTDVTEDPQYIVKKERQIWEKNHITNGDYLILKSEDDILPDEQVIIDIHETLTGIPNDCQSIGHVKCKDTDTIDDVKEAILNMEEYNGRTELKTMTTDRIRLRMRARNLFFDRIFREKNKTLKQLKIKSSTHLVVQFLREPEDLQNNEMVLLLRQRDIANKDYLEFIEFVYKFDKVLPTIGHLCEKISEVMPIEADKMSVAKYIPHAYDWKYWDPNEDIEVKVKNKKGNQKGKKNNKKGGKGKGQSQSQEQDAPKEGDKEEQKGKDNKADNVELKKMATLDLRSTPFLLTEGNILGVRDDSQPGAAEDDFQTEADIKNRERLEDLKKFEKETKGKPATKSNYNDPFKIYTDF